MTPGKLGRLLRWLRGPSQTDVGAPGSTKCLIVCEACGAELANPVAWHETDQSHWWIRLRCGGCGWSRAVIVNQESAERLESDLDPGQRKIATALAAVDRERMLAEVEALITALQRDLIDADDFARH